MYSVVLMVAATSGGDVASFGGHKDGGGCHGTVASTGCTGCSGGGFLGLRSGGGGGLFAGKHKGGCHGSTFAAGCTGAPVAVAPVAVAPVVVAAPAGCHGGGGCSGGGFLGMRNGGGGGLFGKHKSNGCHGGCHGW